jgi:hypothetical protein
MSVVVILSPALGETTVSEPLVVGALGLGLAAAAPLAAGLAEADAAAGALTAGLAEAAALGLAANAGALAFTAAEAGAGAARELAGAAAPPPPQAARPTIMAVAKAGILSRENEIMEFLLLFFS